MREAIQRIMHTSLMGDPLTGVDRGADPVFKKAKADALDQRVKTLSKNRS